MKISFLRKSFSAPLLSSFNEKMPSGCDKTATSAASTLISLAAATLTSSSCSSSFAVSRGSLQQLFPAFVAAKRTPTAYLMQRWPKNAADWRVTRWILDLKSQQSSRAARLSLGAIVKCAYFYLVSQMNGGKAAVADKPGLFGSPHSVR